MNDPIEVDTFEFHSFGILKLDGDYSQTNYRSIIKKSKSLLCTSNKYGLTFLVDPQGKKKPTNE